MAGYGLRQIAAPDNEPISRGEAKEHLAIAAGSTSHDVYVDGLIAAARWHFERMTNRQLVSAQWELTLDDLPSGTGELLLPVDPVQSVVSVTYVDSDGATQTFSDYALNTLRTPARLKPTYNNVWPGVRSDPDAVTIVFHAGYETVPADAKHALKLLIGHWFANRETVVTGTISTNLPIAFGALIDSYKIGDAYTEYSP